MKLAISRYLLRFSYPQNLFTDVIAGCIDLSTKNDLIDVPCGDGITSWRFSEFKNLTVYGYDINPIAVKNAKQNFKNNNLLFDVADIHNVISKHSKAKYWCILNSLFLLPDPEFILTSLYAQSIDGIELFVIVPNINGKNFKLFQANNPTINKLILAEGEFSDYFYKLGWKLKKASPIAYTHSYDRTDTAFFSVFAPFYLTVLNYLQPLFGSKTPNYFLLQLIKK
jgi:hypothetical protein